MLDERWFTPGELAARLGLREATLKRWRASGQGPNFVKTRRNVFYLASDIEMWLESRRRHPNATEASNCRRTHDSKPSKKAAPMTGRFGRHRLKGEK